MIKVIARFFLIFTIINLSCAGKEKVKEMSRMGEKVPVLVEQVRKEKVRKVLHYTGDIKGIDEVDVYPKVQGKLIAKKVKEGVYVEKGEVLAVVDRDISGMKYEPFEVTSPISGTVAKFFVDTGAVVVPPTMSTTMGTIIARVVNMEKAKVIINVGDRDYPVIKVGQKAEVIVDSYPDRIFTGSVSTISPVINPYTKTAGVEVVIPNEKLLLRSGMFAHIDLIVEERDGIVVSQDYILNSDGKNYVFVSENGVARKREIQTGIVEDNKVEILDGLKEGEVIVTVGVEMVSDGMVLEIKGETK